MTRRLEKPSGGEGFEGFVKAEYIPCFILCHIGGDLLCLVLREQCIDSIRIFLSVKGVLCLSIQVYTFPW
jgi:hypothetical protein